MIGNPQSVCLMLRFDVGGGKMGKSKRDSRGFTLIAALLLTVLLSAVAVGLLYMVSNEQRMGGNDLEGNLAYYGAESGVENLTAQLSQLYQSSQSPTPTSICALTAAANWPTNVTGSNITSMNYSEIISWNNQICANGGGAPTVNPTGTWEVALLPAFEFGVFCDGDCDYFAGPPFNFGGRVHANGNLFLSANGGPLTFTDKITAVGQVVTSQLENGTAAGSSAGSYNGKIYIPNASGGCPAAPNSG